MKEMMPTAKHNLLVAVVVLVFISAPTLDYGDRATPTAPEAGRCTSPYDGTWSGTLIGVSEREDFRPNFREGISFDLTLRLSCISTDGSTTSLEVTEARASHWPLSCTGGCRPVTAAVLLGPPGHEGALYLELPNGVIMRLRAEISSDGKILRSISGEPLAWTFGHASRCPEFVGQCRPITSSFQLTKKE